MKKLFQGLAQIGIVFMSMFMVGAAIGYAALPALAASVSPIPEPPLELHCPAGGLPPCLPRDMLIEDNKWDDLPCDNDNVLPDDVDWEKVLEWSTKGLSMDLQVHNNRHDMEILAAAMRWRADQADSTCNPGDCGGIDCKTKVQNALAAFAAATIDYTWDDDGVVGQNDAAEGLPVEEPWALARNIVGYVVAADIIDYENALFEAKLDEMRDTQFSFDSRMENLATILEEEAQ